MLAANTPGYKVAIPCQFDRYASEFRNGLAVVQNGGKYGLIDQAGKAIVPFEYDGLLLPQDLFRKICAENIRTILQRADFCKFAVTLV